MESVRKQSTRSSEEFSHLRQKEAWEKEHSCPSALVQMNSLAPSSGIKKFVKDFHPLFERRGLHGLEMGCGKGRNVIGLAQEEAFSSVSGFDFSLVAIREASRRAHAVGLEAKTHFSVADALLEWPYRDASMDLFVDCFALSDIEQMKGRKHALQQAVRVLKRGGYGLIYELSTEDHYHQMMIEKYSANEVGSFINVQGKFEKVFTLKELMVLCHPLQLIRYERLEKEALFDGKPYLCRHHWLVFQKTVINSN